MHKEKLLNAIPRRDFVRWFNPLSHDRGLGCHWQWKIPSVFVSFIRLCCCVPLTVNLSPTAMLRNQPYVLRWPLPHPFITLSPPSIHHQFVRSSAFLPPGFEMFVSHASIFTEPFPPPSHLLSLLWSPQKRLIQEGWAGVSELLLLCPMRCFHSTFLLLCCFYGPDMLTVQVAQSDVIQFHQLHKSCLLTSSRGRTKNWHSCSSFSPNNESLSYPLK